MQKIKIGVIYGGKSTEHKVSISSANSVIENLNKSKYEIYKIYIDENGFWFKDDKSKIKNICEYIKSLDVIFPVLHGLYGEDGTIQGMLETLQVPYIGAKVLSSAIGMDKVYSKIVFEKAKIPQANYIYLKKNNDKYTYISESLDHEEKDLKEILNLITNKLSLPVFVKPSNSGSSVGINKAHNIQELEEYIKHAAEFDNKIIIEENIKGREIECAVLGNENPKASCIGEILPAEEFYSYNAKYNNTESKTQIPVDISEELGEDVRALAVKAYKAIDCKGLARVDFFVNEETKKTYINEINTMPGFTNISMYPKLWEYSGIKYSDLLDELVKLALEK